MAKLWPDYLPAWVQKDPKRKAEVRVYKKLAKVLDDRFHVFYSTAWLRTDEYGNETDGECDFLIAHPEHGIVAIEVKGGQQVSYNPSNLRWVITGHDGQEHTIKDPVEQAVNSKHEIWRQLSGYGGWNNRTIHLAHGVILPNIGKIPYNLGPSRPAKVFCTAKEFRDDLRGWISKRMNEGNKQKKGVAPLGADGIHALNKLLVRRFTLSFNIGAKISDARDQFDVLERSQYEVLNFIPEIPRTLIRGGAGTGKTVIAIELAIRLAGKGKNVLLTCFNRRLADEIRSKLKQFSRITVWNFHTLCGKIVGSDWESEHSSISKRELFDQVLPNELYKAMESNPLRKWDVVIVDEGQDIRDEWWVAIDSCLKDGGKLRVFMDSNQKIYSGSRKGGRNMDAIPIRLNKNLRNTKPIHIAASVHYSGPRIVSEGPDGLDLEWVFANDRTSKIKRALEKLKKLVSTEEVAAEDIAILVNDGKVKEKIQEILKVHDVPLLTDTVNLGFKTVTIETVRRFKGLERHAVILIVDGSEMEQQELAYVAFSRAKAYLCVICSKREQVWLRGKD